MAEAPKPPARPAPQASSPAAPGSAPRASGAHSLLGGPVAGGATAGRAPAGHNAPPGQGAPAGHVAPSAQTAPSVPGAAPGAKPQRTVSNPNMMRVQSAARAQPLASPKRTFSGDQLKAIAADTGLNVLSILREVWADFRDSNRFFKYKAGIIGLWVLLSVSGFVVACPSSGETNSIGAKLVIAGEATLPIYMVKNESSDAWTDVVTVVNGRYRHVEAQLPPNGAITLSPKVLTGADGQPAPADLRITDLEIDTREGGARLLKGGHAP